MFGVRGETVMATAQKTPLMTEAEYLAAEEIAEERHEYIDGYVYAMSGAKAAHNRIAGNIHTAFNVYLKGKPCQPYMSDMKVKVGAKYFYPDVMVDCSNIPDDSTFTQTPKLIVEVLSKSTRRIDKTVKVMAYTQIPSLEEYVLIDQDMVEVEVLRRSTSWLPERFYLGDEVTFASVGLTLAVEDIYDRVQNSDMVEWLEQKAKS
jgi:Uma2 family endonuclease